MSLDYSAELLFNAVEILASHPGSLKQRLLPACRELSLVGNQAVCTLPERARTLFDDLEAEMSKVPAVGEEGSIAASINAMSETDAGNMIRKVLDLFSMVCHERLTRNYQEGQHDLPKQPSSN